MLNFVSTPIGNLNDISLRAIDVIRSSDYLYAEDTRNTQKLLNFIKIKKKCKSFHEHNEEKISKQIIQHIKNKKIISVLSDAGTPAISDPGYKLIQKCINHNIKYTLIPGPSSVISGLLMSGLPTNRFTFYGFMPRKKNEKENTILEIKNISNTAILFESSRRLLGTLDLLSEFLGPSRKISICKEMTKIHENTIRGSISDVISIINNENISIKGEIVIVIDGSKKTNSYNNLDLSKSIKKEFLKKMSASDASKLISMLTKKNRRDIYKLIIED